MWDDIRLHCTVGVWPIGPSCYWTSRANCLREYTLARIVRHLYEMGPDLSDAQFGFREGRSTVDAVMLLRAVTEEK